MYRVACCAIFVENETQQVFTSPACWKRPVVKHEAVQVNTFPPKPVDRWEKEAAAAQCVFSTLRWHELDFFEMIVAILLFLLGQAR